MSDGTSAGLEAVPGVSEVLQAAVGGPVTSESVRHVLAHFGSGVVIVTARSGRDVVGMTCQSLVSLSLDPPLISICPSRRSTSWPSIRAAGHFCVNILSGEQSELSTRFAQSGGDKFDGVGWSPGSNGAPVLHGVTAWIECRLWQEYDGGDHTIAVGEVLRLSADGDRPPLLYLRGTYLVGHLA